MKVLVVGNGGREHAICRALMTTPETQVLVAPGNGGTGTCGRNVKVVPTDVPALVDLAGDESVDLVIPGPEASLVAGLADALDAAGIPCCGPSRSAARLEGSKAFMRRLTSRMRVPGAAFAVVDNPSALADAVGSWDGVPVVKADGLAAGKGVFLPDSKDACVQVGRELLDGRFGDAGKAVVLEERLEGTEASLFFACDGRDAVLLPHARDHKRLLDDDEGPNTGGMGAISPNPLIDDAIIERATRQIIEPTLSGLEEAGSPFRGFLYAGLMLTRDGPRVLEFNVRMGDPEAEAVLPRLMPGGFLDVCLAAARGTLQDLRIDFDPRATCVVVLAASGYPDSPRKGDTITIDASFETEDRWLDQAGTLDKEGELVTSGGRVAAVVARGDKAAQARKLAYEGVELVHFDGKHVRTDIGGGGL
ncbi:phosphoribosylamine--glycine ligase [Myxococcota bacterium]